MTTQQQQQLGGHSRSHSGGPVSAYATTPYDSRSEPHPYPLYDHTTSQRVYPSISKDLPSHYRNGTTVTLPPPSQLPPPQYESNSQSHIQQHHSRPYPGPIPTPPDSYPRYYGNRSSSIDTYAAVEDGQVSSTGFEEQHNSNNNHRTTTAAAVLESNDPSQGRREGIDGSPREGFPPPSSSSSSAGHILAPSSSSSSSRPIYPDSTTATHDRESLGRDHTIQPTPTPTSSSSSSSPHGGGGGGGGVGTPPLRLPPLLPPPSKPQNPQQQQQQQTASPISSSSSSANFQPDGPWQAPPGPALAPVSAVSAPPPPQPPSSYYPQQQQQQQPQQLPPLFRKLHS
ncbi:hypothetical protein HK102_007998, partial [Quaeritorhiza haematococci]